MAIVIRKRVQLDFLGSRYKDSYLEFKSIPLKDYSNIIDEVTKAGDDGKKGIEFMVKTLQDYFLEGKFEGINVTREEIPDLDQETAITVFEQLTGQLNPKAEGPSTTSSTTAPPPPEK